jgi:membrane protein DedA with SNARE-associated domain
MIEMVVNFAVAVLGKTGYLGVALLMALESACIPIPSEAILPFGGYLASSANTGNRLSLIGVIIWGTVGGTLGSLFAYCIGAYGGRPLVERYAAKLRLSKSHLRASDRFFEKYGEKIAFYSRLLPIVRTFISLPAGISKMNIKKFAAYTFIGSLIWSIILGYAGYLMGQNWGIIRSWLHIADYVVLVAIIGTVVYFVVRRQKKVAEE